MTLGLLDLGCFELGLGCFELELGCFELDYVDLHLKMHDSLRMLIF